MGTNHQDFSGNAQAFSGVRLGETADAMGLTNQFTRMMDRTMADIMPQWPDTMNAPNGPPPQFLFSVVVNGLTIGPCGLDALAQMASQGQINAQSPVRRQGMPGWQPAGTIPELAMFFAGAGAPPSAPVNPPGTADLRTAANQADSFRVAVNGQTYGPYDLNMLSQMAAQGQINAQSQVWRQGMPGWQAAGTVPELARLFAGAGASPMPPPPPPPPGAPPPAPGAALSPPGALPPPPSASAPGTLLLPPGASASAPAAPTAPPPSSTYKGEKI